MKVLKNCKLFLSIAVFAGLFQACQHGVCLSVTNNTGVAITVNSYDAANGIHATSIANQLTKEVPSPTRLTITMGSNTIDYGTFPSVPTTYWERRTFGLDHILISAEKDGAIRVQLRGDNGTATNAVAQPVGFPLKPVASSK